MAYDRGTGPRGRRWMITGGGGIPLKGKEGRCWFGTGWKTSLSLWTGPWWGWDSVLRCDDMLWM